MVLDLIETQKIEKGTGYVFSTKDGFLVLSKSTILDDKAEGRLKWKIGISLASGCDVRCTYCFTNSLNKNRVLHFDEIIDQVNHILVASADGNQQFKEKKIEMKEMGDPLTNPTNTLEAISRLYSNQPDFRYVVSTSGPALNQQFFNGLMGQRDNGTKIRLQFSCHTTSDEDRRRLSPSMKMMTLKEIAEITERWYDGNEKATLNFIPINGYELSAEKLAETFDPGKVFIKISYVDNNPFTRDNHISNKPGRDIINFVEGLKKSGFSYAFRNN